MTTEPRTLTAVKVSGFRGDKTYRYGAWMVYVKRIDYSEKAGCGFRKRWSILSYSADRDDGRTRSGIGGIRNAVKDLDKINNGTPNP
jgi:hypothetical protein